MDNTATGWIDIPVVQAVEYFSGILSTFYRWGAHYAVAIGTVGLCWSAFKLINSRFTLREFWWDTFYKWLLFILFMSAYPLLTAGVSVVGNRIGIRAGNGRQAIIDTLSSMKRSIEQDLAVQAQWAEELEVELSSRFETFTFDTSFGDSEDYDAYIDSLTEEIGAAKFNSRGEKKKALALMNEYREKNKFHGLFGARTLQAIKDVLVEKRPDGTDGDVLTDSYIDLNIWLKNADGSDSYYLSPAAILRVSLLGCQILWEKNQIAYALELDGIDDEDVNFVRKGFSKMGATMAHVPTMIMTVLCCVVLVACTIFAVIQYVMTILEYTVIMAVGAAFIPLILFDGTKDIPRKLIPVFTGFLIKMIVMDICLLFVFYLFIQETVDIMAENGGMNWVTFATICFTSLIALVLTQNAPKIAMTLLTGQPQLSMGEFVQAVGSAAVGGRLAAKGAASAGRAAREGTRRAAQGAVDVRGGITKIHAAGRSASQAVRDSGGTVAQARQAASRGMLATVTGDLKDKFRNAGNNFLHGGGTGRPGGGGAGGSQAHQRSGQDTSREPAGGGSRTLNATSNPKFRTATRFDPATQGSVNMTRREFYDEKRGQGAGIGKDAARKVLGKAGKKR